MEKSYLVKRNNVLYFRMAVPKAFRNYIPGREIKYSLKETDLQMAERKCSLLGEKLLELFNKAKTEEVIMAALHPLVKRICANILFFDGQNHLRQYGMSQYTPEECDSLISCIQSLYKKQNIDNYVAEKFRFYANQYGFDLNPANKDFKTMVLDFYLGFMETLRIQKERTCGNLYNGYDDATPDGRFSKILSPKDVSPELQVKENFRAVEIMTANPVPTNVLDDDEPDTTANDLELHNFEQELAATPQAIISQPETASGISLKEAVSLFLEEKQIQKKGVTLKTLRELTSQLNVLPEVFGDINVASIRRPQIVDLMKNVLYRYPKHRAKRYKETPLFELLEMDIEKIDDKTQSDYFITWKSFFNWCRICEYAPLTFQIYHPDYNTLYQWTLHQWQGKLTLRPLEYQSENGERKFQIKPKLQPKNTPGFHKIEMLQTSKIFRLYIDGELVLYAPSFFRGGYFAIIAQSGNTNFVELKNFELLKILHDPKCPPEKQYKLPNER